ncbi:MAG: YdcF family protein [Pedobacter sp.]|nr:YdcF family protein [Pedobacter sp.]
MCIAIACLWFFSNRFIIGKVYNAYEEGYPVDQHYDVGIVLGGFSSYDPIKKQIVFNTSGDRFFQALFLYREKKIDRILISGGNSEGRDRIKEADVAARQLKIMGVPDSAIMVENQSRNTAENAELSYKKISASIPNAKVVVVTSAWHIPRARVHFDKYFKEKVTFYPSNYIGKTHYNLTDYVIPYPGAFIDWKFML